MMVMVMEVLLVVIMDLVVALVSIMDLDRTTEVKKIIQLLECKEVESEGNMDLEEIITEVEMIHMVCKGAEAEVVLRVQEMKAMVEVEIMLMTLEVILIIPTETLSERIKEMICMTLKGTTDPGMSMVKVVTLKVDIVEDYGSQ